MSVRYGCPKWMVNRLSRFQPKFSQVTNRMLRDSVDLFPDLKIDLTADRSIPRTLQNSMMLKASVQFAFTLYLWSILNIDCFN
jgi:hypothetical protein